MNKKFQKKATKVMAVGCCAAIAVSSFAFFTDRVETKAQVTAGTVGITESDTWTDNLKNGPQSLNNLNPGDSRSLLFSVSNTGNKAVDVRHSIQLSVVDAAGNPKALTMGADIAAEEMLQFDIFKKSDVVTMSNDSGNAGYILKDGAQPIFSTDSVDGTTQMGAQRDISKIANGVVKYYFADTILDGVGTDAETGYAKAEHVETTLAASDAVVGADADGNANAQVTYDYVLIFRDTALNDFQGCTIYLDMEVEAKQHLNTKSSWQHIETISTTLNTSGLVAQDNAVQVAPDNTTGVTEDVTDTTAGTYNTHTEH